MNIDHGNLYPNCEHRQSQTRILLCKVLSKQYTDNIPGSRKAKSGNRLNGEAISEKMVKQNQEIGLMGKQYQKISLMVKFIRLWKIKFMREVMETSQIG